MSKSIKKILVFIFILASIIMLSSCVKAVTADEAKSSIASGSVIIGKTRFTPDTVVSAVRAAKAGADDMAIYISKNGTKEGYTYPKMYYYLAGTLFERNEEGKLTTSENQNVSSFEIYYVNDEVKPDVPMPTQQSYTVTFKDGVDVVSSKAVLKGDKVGTLPTVGFEHHSNVWVLEGTETEVTADTVITANTVVVAKWTEDAKSTITFMANGEEFYKKSDYVGTKIILADEPTKTEDEDYEYEFAGWYDSETDGTEIEEYVISESNLTLYAHFDVKTIKEKTVDFSVLAEGETEGGKTVLDKKSDLFVSTFYDRPNNGPEKKEIEINDENESIYYLDLGKYTGLEDDPTTLTINEVAYDGTVEASLSVGNNYFINVPVWKIKVIEDEKHVLVALPWLCVESLPKVETVVEIAGEKINVKLYKDDVTDSVLKVTGAQLYNTSHQADYTNNIEFTENSVTLTRGHRTMGAGVILSYNDQPITTNNYTGIIFRMDTENKMSMAVTTPEAGGVLTYAKYLNYDIAPITKEGTSTKVLKIAIPEHGVITLTIKFVDVVEAASANDLQAILESETEETNITLKKDVVLEQKLEIPENKEVTIDLNGSTIKSAVTTNGIIENKGTLILNDSSDSGIVGFSARNVDEPYGIVAEKTHAIYNTGKLIINGGTYDALAHKKAALYNEGGEVIINGGTFKRSNEAGTDKNTNGGNSWYTIVNHGTMTFNDGKVENGDQSKGTGRYSSLFENGYFTYSTDYKEGTNLANPTLNINGGVFVGGLNTIKNDDGGVLKISGGTFTGYTQACFLNWNIAEITNGVNENGDVVVPFFDGSQSTYTVLNGYKNNGFNNGELTITGGKFTAKTGETYIIDKMGSATTIGKIIKKADSYEITQGKFISETYNDYVEEYPEVTE